MFAVVLMSTSCEEENVTPDELTETPKITLEEFEDLWNFVQAEYDDKTYYSCADVEDDPDADSRLRLVEIRIELIPSNYIVEEYNCKIYYNPICQDGNVWGIYCNLDETQNTFKLEGGMVFKILEYNKSTEELKGELIEGSGYNLVGVKYVWQK